MGCIYARINKINGKRYVGQASNMEQRQNRWNNLSIPYAGSLINRARKKYGVDGFELIILKECPDEEMNQLEMYFIKELNTKRPNGYNLTDGGNSTNGYTHTEETKRKMSEALKGKNNPNYGKHLSEEHKRKLSEALRGKHHTEEARRKMSESKKGRTLSEEHKRKISDAQKGENNHFYGKHHTEETKRKLSKPVLQLDKRTGEVIREFPSAREVERVTGYDQANISKCCLGKLKSAYGFRWKFA